MIRYIQYTHIIYCIILQWSTSDTMSGNCDISIPAEDRLSYEPLLLSTNWLHCWLAK